MSAAAGPAPDLWRDALDAASLAAVDPRGLGGLRLRARPGPLRDRFLSALHALMPENAPRRRIPPGIEPGRLIGGLDLAATLAAGRPVLEMGVLAAADGGIAILAMAERAAPHVAASVAAALDHGAVRIEREGLSAERPARILIAALDEGGEDEDMSAALADRLAFDIDLDAVKAMPAGADAVSPGDVAGARARLGAVAMPAAIDEALAALAFACGAASLRQTIFLCRAARAAAALRGAEQVETEDAALAARLVLGPDAIAELAAGEAEPDPGETVQEPPAEGRDDEAASSGPLREVILEAAAARLPRALLEELRGQRRDRRRGTGGKAGSLQAGGRRGPAVGTVAKAPRPAARIDVTATLRAAAPWQAVRRGQVPAPDRRLAIRAEDFRFARRRERRGTTAIFAVDASGSAAFARLAETKGAIELLLAECYIRRDEVALVAFRGEKAEILLEPTRSLVRAKRSLSALPGGGGTPLADGILASLRLARAVERRGRDAIGVFLTDGRANIALDGRPGREAAATDAGTAARSFRACGVRGLVIDTGARPQTSVGDLARALGAEYLALPRGGSERISRELAARMKE